MLPVGARVLPALLTWPRGEPFSPLRRWPTCLRSLQAAGPLTPSCGQCRSRHWSHGALQSGWVPASTLGCQHPPHEVGLTHCHLGTEASGL